MKNEIQCPNCRSYKIKNISARYFMLVFGGTSLLVGMFLAIFIIGIPFLAVGIAMVLIGLCIPDSRKRRCADCWMTFKV